MERNTEGIISQILSQLRDSIQARDEQASIQNIEHLMSIRPACKIKVVSESNSSVHGQILNYVNSMDSSISLRHIPNAQNVSLPSNIVDSTVTISNESSGIHAKSIDSFNEEIYKKLIGAGNSRDNAKYAATGVSTMSEAMSKLKNRKK